MKKYEITIAAYYEKTIPIHAETPSQANDMIKAILFNTDLIKFSEDDFICGEAVISDLYEDDYDEDDKSDENDICIKCPDCCPLCGCCLLGEED